MPLNACAIYELKSRLAPRARFLRVHTIARSQQTNACSLEASLNVTTEKLK